jgi:hypothetical protein
MGLDGTVPFRAGQRSALALTEGTVKVLDATVEQLALVSEQIATRRAFT